MTEPSPTTKPRWKIRHQVPLVELTKTLGGKMYAVLQAGDKTGLCFYTPDIAEIAANLLSQASAVPYEVVEADTLKAVIPDAHEGKDVGFWSISFDDDPVGIYVAHDPTMESGKAVIDALNRALDYVESTQEYADAAQEVASLTGAATTEHAKEASGDGRATVRQGESKLSIRECHACGGSHRDVEFHEYRTPRPIYTHWFSCPTTGDPVSITLMSYEGRDFELSAEVLEKLAVAHSAGEFFVAVFWITKSEPKNTINIYTVGHRFPLADFDECHQMLGREFAKRVGPPEAKPLKRAVPTPRSMAEVAAHPDAVTVGTREQKFTLPQGIKVQGGSQTPPQASP